MASILKMMNSWLEFQGLDLNFREGRRGTWEAKEILSVDSILFEGFSGGPTLYFLVTYHLLLLVERGRQEMCAFSWSHWYPQINPGIYYWGTRENRCREATVRVCHSPWSAFPSQSRSSKQDLSEGTVTYPRLWSLLLIKGLLWDFIS